MTFRATGRGHTVAIKELPVGRLLDPKTLELFEREARVLGELRHPRIPALIESFSDGAGAGRALYLVQELVEGPTLASEAESRRYCEDEVLAMVVELAEVLSYLHALSPAVVHRDLKPQNVIRGPMGWS
ncbi:MAG: protein kinase [Proteobacteria bacterium]|nr:protein kinase [Pseudomonadota bacterium]